MESPAPANEADAPSAASATCAPNTSNAPNVENTQSAPNAAKAPSAPGIPSDAGPRRRLLTLLREALAAGRVQRLLLGRYRGPEPGLQRLLVRPLQLRGEPRLSFVYRYATRDVTKNLPIEDGLTMLDALLAQDFEHAHLQTDARDIQLLRNRRGEARLQVGRLAAAPAAEAPDGPAPAAAAAAAAHDRHKPRWVDLASPWLVDLGVTDAQQRLIPAMARKWKQIDKFVETVDRAFAPLRWPAGRPVRVLDFGCGKGYLTFALHQHLSGRLGLDARVTGVELREDLVHLCNAAAAKLPTPGLAFEQGDVRELAPGEVDIMIALHACDIATDHALHAGVRAGASLIVSAPCCHKQLRPQLSSPPLLAPLLQHGIHLGQQAEMLTDGLRALLLEEAGYDTQVFEFVSLEHTSKNKMILATRRARPLPPARRAALRRQIEELKAFYGVREHCLETLLARDAEPPAAADAGDARR
jgi:SAM-dependent methyltransferase